MMDFRYHIVSLVAVFLALATGVALGTGPLQGSLDQPGSAPTSRKQPEMQLLRDRLATLRQQAAFEADFATALGPSLLDGRLAGRSILVVALPQADATSVEGVRTALRQAGASVEPTLQFTSSLLDVANRQVVDELSSQLSSALPKPAAASATTYDRAGLILARALVTQIDAGDALDGPATRISSAFRTAKLIEPAGALQRRASLVVVVAGSGVLSDQATTQARDSIVVSLAQALDARSDGVVVVGPPRAALGDGVVAAVRDAAPTAASVSTVDVVNLPSGQICAAYALAEQAQGGSGNYGIGGTVDAALPTAGGAGSP